MAIDFYIKRGDTGPSITAVLSDPSGAVDLTGASVKFKLRLADTGALVVNADATIVTPVQGSVAYGWESGDTAVAGEYLAEWEVTFQNGEIITFPNDGYLRIKVTGDLP